MKTIIWVGIFFFLAEASAQTVADSLMQLVQTRNDSTAIRAGFELNKYFVNKKNQPDSVLFYTPKLLEKAQKIEDHFGEAKCYSWMGNAYIVKLNYEEAIGWFQKALQVAQRYKMEALQADLHNRIGICYNNQNKQAQAIIHLIQAAKTFERLNDLPGQAQAYYAISLAYKHQKQPERRLEYSRKAATIAEGLPRSEAIKKAIIFASTAICLIETGPKNKAQLMEAKRYADLGISLCEDPAMKKYSVEYYVAYSGYFYAKKEYQQSIDAALKGLNSGVTLTEYERFNLFYRLAEAYREEKEIKLAYKYIDSARLLTSIINPTFLSLLAQSAYRLNKMSGASEAALKSLEEYQKQQDSILNIEKTKALNEIVEKYETEIKDEQILRLEQEQLAINLKLRALIAIVVSVVLLLILILIYYQNRVTRNKLKWVEAEQRLNRIRMNPHFFFNALSTLQGTDLKANNPEEIVTQISKFAKLMRQTLEATYTEYATLEDEIAFLQQYIEVYASSIDQKFSYSVSIDENLLDFKIPVMLLQPFVENAIEHGVSKIDYAGEIKLSVTPEAKGIKIVIEDNGKGIEGGEKAKSHISRATQIIKDRFTLLSDSNASFSVRSTSSGTAVTIHLPEKK